MDNNNIKIESWLPIFPGFYGTAWEFDFDDQLLAIDQINEQRGEKNLPEIENIGYGEKYPDFQTNHDEIKKDVGEHYCKEIQQIVKDFCVDIKFQCVYSPKFYNFSNDSINCEYTISQDNISKIIDYIKSNKDDFSDYLRQNFTSRPGFISNHSNKYNDWIVKLESSEWVNFKFELGSIMGFIAINEENSSPGDINLDIRNSILDFFYPKYIINYEEFLK